MFALPREVINWLDSLDLAYSVRNPKRDLSNGFVIAEVLCRYFPKDLNIYSFDNGLKIEKKTDNWEQIAKYLKKRGFILKKEEYEPIIYYADGAADRFLRRLYEFLTRKRYPERPKKFDTITVPHFAQPTASMLTKNTELTRIVDNKEKAERVVYQLMMHSESHKQQLKTMGIDRYMATKKAKMLTLKNESQKKIQKPVNTIPEVGDIKPIELKSLNSAAGGKKSKETTAIIIEARSALEFIAEQAKDLLEEIADKEIEEPKPEEGENDALQLIQKILSNCKEISDESLNQLFQLIENNLDGIAERLSNNFQDFKKFFELFQTPLLDLYWGSVPFMSLVDLLKSLGNKLLKLDPTTTEIMFESLILPQMVNVIMDYYNKRESICQIIFSFCLVNSTSRQRFLKRIKEHLSQNLKLFIAILSVVVSFYNEEDFTEDLYNLYFYYAIVSLDFPSPVTRAQGLKILNEIVYINYVPVIQVIGKLENLSRDQWWEVKALILILCSSLLIYISKEKDGNIHAQSQDIVQSSGEPLNLSGAQQRGEGEEEEEEEKIVESSQNNDQDLIIQEEQEHNEEMKEIAQMSDQIQFKTFENEEAFLINLVNSIFRLNTNQNVLKIGLIYLANILNKYPVLCPRYLEILLHIADVIRSSILDINPIPGTEEDYIAQNSFKYKLTGAPLLWNSVGIAEALESYVQEKDLASFERVHSEIFERCLVQPLEAKDSSVWLRIYESLKWHVFVGLCDRDLCQLCGEIVKKFFTYEQIQDEILENSKVIFYKTLTLLYHPDRDSICKENMLDFFEFLQSHESNKFKEYIYRIIKEFSEKNKEQFLQSNLVDFMNEVAKQRREEIFGADILQ